MNMEEDEMLENPNKNKKSVESLPDMSTHPRFQTKEEDLDSEDMNRLSGEGDGEEFLPDFLSNLSRFEYFRQKIILTDVMFRGLSDSHFTDIPAHRVVLAVASPYFENLFKDSQPVYEVPFSAATLDEVMCYIYTGKLPVLNEDNLEEVFLLAETFQLPDLFQRCKQFLKTELNMSNFKKFQSLVQRFPFGQDTALQFMFYDFENYSQTPEFFQLSIDRVHEIVTYKDIQGTPIPSASLLQGVLNWVQADIHSRQRHLLQLMQFITLEDVPADVMKNFMIALNYSYRSETSNVQSEPDLTSSVDPGVVPAQMQPAEATLDTAILDKDKKKEGKDKEGIKQRRVTVPAESKVMSELFDDPARFDRVTTEKVLDKSKGSSSLKGSKSANTSASSISGRKESSSSGESARKRGHNDGEPPAGESSKKPRMSKGSSSEGVEVVQAENVNARPEYRYRAEEGLDFVYGETLTNVHPTNPLMFYLSKDSKQRFNMMVYDFSQKVSEVLIQDLCLDHQRAKMAYLNKKLYLVGGKSDGTDAQGGLNHQCLDSVLCFSDFPRKFEGTFQTLNWTGNGPIYCQDLLHESRSDCGVTVWGNSIFALGGRGSSQSIIRSLNSAERFTEGSGWSVIKSMNKNRENFGIGILNNQIYVVGGWISCTSTSCSLGMVERYNPEINEWHIAPPLLTRRCGIRVATIDSCIFAIGGSERAEKPGKLSHIEMLDPRVKHWMPIKSRSAFPFTSSDGVVTCFEGKICSIDSGPEGLNGRPLIEIFDLRTRKWLTYGKLQTTGYFSSATFINLP